MNDEPGRGAPSDRDYSEDIDSPRDEDEDDDESEDDDKDDDDDDDFLIFYNREYRKVDTSFADSVTDMVEIERHLLEVVRTGVSPRVAVARYLADDNSLTPNEAEDFMYELPLTVETTRVVHRAALQVEAGVQ